MQGLKGRLWTTNPSCGPKGSEREANCLKFRRSPWIWEGPHPRNSGLPTSEVDMTWHTWVLLDCTIPRVSEGDDKWDNLPSSEIDPNFKTKQHKNMFISANGKPAPSMFASEGFSVPQSSESDAWNRGCLLDVPKSKFMSFLTFPVSFETIDFQVSTFGGSLESEMARVHPVETSKGMTFQELTSWVDWSKKSELFDYLPLVC